MPTGHELSLLAQFIDVLRTGGPWAMLAIMLLMYWAKDRELRKLYLRVIDMATVQAGLAAKTQMTIGSLKDTLSTAIAKWRD